MLREPWVVKKGTTEPRKRRRGAVKPATVVPPSLQNELVLDVREATGDVPTNTSYRTHARGVIEGAHEWYDGICALDIDVHVLR